MRKIVHSIFFLTLIVPGYQARTQVENVPVGHPVYLFLDRMETRHVISGYHDAILPISRSEAARLLVEAESNDSLLSQVERDYLADFLMEFRFDITASLDIQRSMITPPDSVGFSLFGHIFGREEKFLFAGSDSSISFFANALLTVDGRWIRGDDLGDQGSQFIRFGGRFRGTAVDHLGYYLQGTNAQFWGSRGLLQRDPQLSQAHTLQVTDTRNFDFAEGYVRYANDYLSLQVGRERLLWGLAYDQSLVSSRNVRVYDFIRVGAGYKSFQYTFIHAWLLGEQSSIQFTVPGDSTVFTEPTNADKYLAAHRFELTFPQALDIGFQEMVIYSNRSPDLAYLNPLIVIESAQRSRGERDNVYWAFDVETHFLAGLQLTGTILFDDIHLWEFFEPKWYNRYAYQAGMLLTDPLFFPNMNLIAEYTRVEPYVFSHNRSRENTYSSLGSILGPRIGPNADAWHFRLDWFPANRVFVSTRVTLERSGENTYDENGYLVRNVGGDFRQPHRPTDPETRIFLDGILMKRENIEGLISWEALHQVWLDGWYLYESVRNITESSRTENHTGGARVRMEF